MGDMRITFDAVLFGRTLQIFRGKISSQTHGVTSRKTVMFTATALRTPDSIRVYRNICCNE